MKKSGIRNPKSEINPKTQIKKTLFFIALLILSGGVNSLYGAGFSISDADKDKVKKSYNELFPDADKKETRMDESGRKILTEKEIAGIKEAINDSRAIIAKFQNDRAWCSQLQNQIGDLYKDLGEYKTAVDEYKKVIENYPDRKDACLSAAEGIKECEKLAAAPAPETNEPAAEAVQKSSAMEEPLKSLPEAVETDLYVFYLKNGREIRGEILKETEKSFTIRFSGNTVVFDKEEIKSYKKAE